MLTTKTISKNQYEITGEDFRADIVVNRDRMDSCQITKLPSNQEARMAILKHFKEIFYRDFGAKTSLHFPSDYYDDLIAAGFELQAAGAGAVFAAIEDLAPAILDMKEKPEVKAILAQLGDEKSDLQLLSRPEDFVGRHEELFQFKKAHAEFVTPQKITDGIYSASAEKEKIENPAIKQFVITCRGKMIASSMMFTAHGLTYQSDIIIHKDYRNKKYCQAIMVKSYLSTLAQYPGIHGAWIITGGDGAKDVGIHLYRNLLKTKPITEKIAREQGFLIKFMPPGPKLLAAMADRPVDEVKVTAPTETKEITATSDFKTTLSHHRAIAKFALFGSVAATVAIQIATNARSTPPLPTVDIPGMLRK